MDGKHVFSNSLLHGDCVARLNQLPAGCVDLAFADPPFNIGYDYDVYDDKRDRNQYLTWSKSWIGAVYRALKPDGTFWLAIGDEYAAELKVSSQELGFHCRSWVIWYYTFGVNCKQKFSRSHAHLFYFVKDPAHFTFRHDSPENRIPSARQLVYGDNRANPMGRLPDDTWILRPQDLADCFTPDEDTWYFPRVAGTFKERAGFHGCQMPEQLLGRIIRGCSHEGELVLDPFAGSSTTLVVAKKLGREYLGLELSEDYVKRGTERLANARKGDPLDGAPEPLMSAPTTSNGRKVQGYKGPEKSATAPSEPRSKDKPAKTPAPPASSLAKSPAEMDPAKLAKELAAAFRKTNEGYSLDRVVADPDLNRAFLAACQASELPGDARTWNRTLFRLRKAGRLIDIPTERRTECTWESCDRYLFASEIALRQMLDDGCLSLDEVLCDPELAAEFDRIASSFAPGFTSLDYRWGALKLRKEAKLARSRAKDVTLSELKIAQAVRELDMSELPASSGLYLVVEKGDKRKLYAGQTLNLRERFERQFAAAVLPAWSPYALPKELQVRVLLAEGTPAELLACQSVLVRQYQPQMNYPDLAAEPSLQASVP